MLVKSLLLCLVLKLINAHAIPIKNTDKLAKLPFQKIQTLKNSNSTNSTLQERSYYGLTSIYNDNQVQYLVNIDVGSPAQSFAVIVDTGR